MIVVGLDGLHLDRVARLKMLFQPIVSGRRQNDARLVVWHQARAVVESDSAEASVTPQNRAQSRKRCGAGVERLPVI